MVYECRLQNGTMDILIALTLLKSNIMIVPSAVYVTLMFLTGGLYLFVELKKDQTL